MAITRLNNWTVTILDTDGNPAQGYQVKAYIDGSTTETQTYSDASGTVASYPLIVPADGVLEIYISDDIVYKFEIFKPDGATKVRTITDIDAGGGTGTTTKTNIFVNSTDTTAGYLNGKLVAGDNTSLTVGNTGGDETLTVSSKDEKVSVNASSTPQYLINAITAGANASITDNGDSIAINSTDTNDKVGVDSTATPQYLKDALTAGNRIVITDNGDSLQFGVNTDDIGDSNGSVITIRGRQVFGDTSTLLSFYPINTGRGGGEITAITDSGLSAQMNLVTSAFTAPSDGYYFFSLTGTFDTFTSPVGSKFIVSLLHHDGLTQVNNDLRCEIEKPSTSASVYPFAISGWLYMTAGEIVQPVCDTVPPTTNDQYQDLVFSVDTSANTAFSGGASWFVTDSVVVAEDGNIAGDKLLTSSGIIYNWSGAIWETTGINLDISGSNTVAFKSRASGSWDIDPSTSSITIPFNAANAGTILNDIDTSSGLDDGVYTIPASGQYSITSKAGLIHSGANASSVTECYVNIDKYEAGSWVVVGELRCKILANDVEGVCNTTYLDLVAGDLVRASIKLVGSASANGVTVDRWFEFSGHKV